MSASSARGVGESLARPLQLSRCRSAASPEKEDGDEIAILRRDGCPRIARGSGHRGTGELLTAKAAVAQRSKAQAGARGQDTQAPRGQDTQAPRNVARARAAALANARRLVNEAEFACKDADSARATSNARAAIELLKYLP